MWKGSEITLAIWNSPPHSDIPDTMAAVDTIHGTSQIRLREHVVQHGQVLRRNPLPLSPLLQALCTLLQKRKEVRLEFPATIPVPYEPPGSGLLENIKIKKIYREVISRQISKTTFFLDIFIVKATYLQIFLLIWTTGVINALEIHKKYFLIQQLII